MTSLLRFCLLASSIFGLSRAGLHLKSDKPVQILTRLQELTFVEGETREVVFVACGTTTGLSGEARVSSTHGGVVSTNPSVLDLSGPSPWNVTLTGKERGHDVIFLDFNSTVVDVSEAYVVVTVARSQRLELLSNVVGWIYFVAWSVSFYPQCYENWKRKSVVGLNFDFLALNIIGFFMYSLFNCGLYWNSEVEQEYFAAHPRGLNPVLLNDVVFSLHAVCITCFTIIQCFLYERGGQRVSKIATGIIVVILVVFAVSFVLALSAVVNWLQFLYICSYIKLAITLMKYVPQAFMNYKRKSTIGWSIGNVILDFTGGMLSMMQMIINADNYDDWDSIFGDPTKFGLGLFSVLFDILFLVQHYMLYRDRGYTELPGTVREEPTPTGADVEDKSSATGLPDVVEATVSGSN